MVISMAPFDATDSVRVAQYRMTRAFADAGLPTPELDARFLMQSVIGIDGTAIITHPERSLGDRAEQLWHAMRRRLSHEPVARIVGEREFYGRAFTVTPDVLDPRADSEAIIDLALEIANDKGWRDAPLRIADIGTGSGILAVTLLAEFPKATAVATDISAEALAVAQANARRHGVSERLTSAVTRGLQGVTGPFDLIVSNPPYIPTDDISGLSVDVRNYDPWIALDGGADGLHIYREIVNDVRSLCSLGWVILEVGAGQVDDVSSIFTTLSRLPPRMRQDLGGHPRAVAFEILC
ncbi:MAG: protein-(glutamine-N5) methyltransferase, release factor-specific [Hyphomicrobium sp.]|nr:MAG: protein-(glutamine-N5) methyltransferase, release factor-specific [Hyphomicrobium sp.]